MKNLFWLLSISVLFLILLGSCHNDPPTGTVSVGRFQYRAYDTSGTIVVEGWLTLTIIDSTNVQGEWHFTKVGNPANIGFHYGDGVLRGAFYHAGLSVGLNPNYIDNNVVLFGTYDGNSYVGTWQWIGFPGVLNHGTFEAVKFQLF